MAKEKKINMVILGLLHHEGLSGYDIKKRIDGAIGFFWNGSFGNIYPALKELEENGLIKSSNVSVGSREKIVYSITAEGEAALNEWIRAEQVSNELRYETMLKLFFGGAADRAAAIHNIEVFEEKIKKELAVLKMHCRTLKDALDEEDHLYYYLTASFGAETYETYLKWCDEAKKLLNKTYGEKK